MIDNLIMIRYFPNPNPGFWGLGGGMLQYIDAGDYDASVGGFTFTHKRAVVVDFTSVVTEGKTFGFIQRSGQSRLSFDGYLSEFKVK